MMERYDRTNTWLLLVGGAALLGAGVALRISGDLAAAFTTTAVALAVFGAAHLRTRR